MAKELENDPRIPTLTDVVKQGNPSLMFNLKPPPSPAVDEDESGSTDTTAGSPEEVMELEVFEREVQEEMFQVTGHPDDSDLVISDEIEHEPEALSEGSAVLAHPDQAAENDEVVEKETPEQPKSSFSLEALGLPFDFFSKAAKENEDETEPAQELEDTQAVTEPPELPAEESDNALPDLDVESVLMALEAPISEILQRHMESARNEIHGLIREQLESHHQK